MEGHSNDSGDATELKKLRKINKALMDYVERSTDQQGNAYSLFQTAINLESLVRQRTEELTTTLHSLELTNRELTEAKIIAENANLSKTRFLAAASHDLLQPLNAANLLMSSLSEFQNSEESRALAIRVERSLDTINELLRSLLDISRLDAGVVHTDIEEIELSELLDRLESDFKPIANKKGLQLRFRPTSARVVSDRGMLRRVLQNIISNALQYTRTGGVLVGVRPHANGYGIDVYDTGIGITHDQHEEIFEEFHRCLPVGDDNEELSAGLGLGLAIVSRMVFTLNHSLTFNSVPGRGSSFRISVPKAKCSRRAATVEQKTQDSSLVKGILGANVLLIENDIAVLDAMDELLKRWRCKVRKAANQTQAISALDDNEWTPDVLIADQHLDLGDLGTTTVENIRESQGRDIPAIIITADPSDQISANAKSLGIELMYKPVKPAQLRALLAHVLSDQTAD